MSQQDEYYRRAIVKRWIDGDTVKVWVDLGFGVWQSATLQVAGVDTPDVGEEGKAASAHYAAMIAPKGSELIVQPLIPDRDAAGQSFGRWVANVWTADGRHLAQVLVQNGYGVSSD